eukprot:1541085-Rhodomonas_salina.2
MRLRTSLRSPVLTSGTKVPAYAVTGTGIGCGASGLGACYAVRGTELGGGGGRRRWKASRGGKQGGREGAGERERKREGGKGSMPPTGCVPAYPISLQQPTLSP